MIVTVVPNDSAKFVLFHSDVYIVNTFDVPFIATGDMKDFTQTKSFTCPVCLSIDLLQAAVVSVAACSQSLRLIHPHLLDLI